MASTLFKNLYADLGIEPSASSDDSESYVTWSEYETNVFSARAVRKAYRKRALETHPDKLEPNASDKEKQEAERHFHRVIAPVFSKVFSSRFSAASDVTV